MNKNNEVEYTAYTLFTYNTRHLSKTDKVRFYYALKGRDGKTGIISSYSIQQLIKTVLLVPPSHAVDVQEFLKYWNCEFTAQEVLLK